jgi:hypothetical protein
MTEADPLGRRRPRDLCPARAERPGAAERAMLERLEELRGLVDEYQELLVWARRLGVDVPANRNR